MREELPRRLRLIRLSSSRGLVQTIRTSVCAWLTLVVLPLMAIAQSGVDQPAYQPLRSADMGSPRDTLKSFLEDYSAVLAEFHEKGSARELSREALAAYDRASSTLNFSTTPDGGARWVQQERLIFLKEVLDRLELPSFEAIPGREEVEAEDLTEWIIPNTRMRIVREETGPYAGEWRFSPRTVQLLPRHYRQIKDLPYKSGATPGIYEAARNNKEGVINRERELSNRLRAANTMSPRATLESFMQNMNQAYELVQETHARLEENLESLSPDEIADVRARIEDSLDRAVSTLDLSEVPGALRDDVGIESALQIKEVLDRLGLAPIEQIPDLEEVRSLREANHIGPIRWTYPNTDLEIVEVMEGPNAGAFLFSPRTVEGAARAYEAIRHIPYRYEHYQHFSAKYKSPDLSPGFYAFYVTTPGDMVPLANPLGRLVEELPDFLHDEIWSQSIWQWIALLIVYLVMLALAILVFLAMGRLVRAIRNPYSAWLRLVAPLLVAWLVDLGTYCITEQVNVTGHLIFNLLRIEGVAVYGLLAWAAFCLCRAVAETIIAAPQIRDESIDASLLRLTSRIAGTLFLFWVLLVGLEGLGLEIWPLIAGLGVGGLAVALAFRPTMENIISSIMIFADKPYRVGQRVIVLGADGVVESIGLRSTKIRLLTGHLTTIPNEKMASVAIENVGQRPYIRRVFNLSVTYDTNPAKMNRAVEILREILAIPEDTPASSPASTAEAHPNRSINQPEYPPRVFFNELQADSLNILVMYWFHPPDYWKFLEHANWINVRIMECFAEEGIEFAFPTQTLHLAGDPNRPLTIGQRWESTDGTAPPLELVSQAAAFGAQSALGSVSFASHAGHGKSDGSPAGKTE